MISPALTNTQKKALESENIQVKLTQTNCHQFFFIFEIFRANCCLLWDVHLIALEIILDIQIRCKPLDDILVILWVRLLLIIILEVGKNTLV